MPLEEVTEVVYTTAATAKGGREGRVTSEDQVIDLPLGKPGSTSDPKANPETLFAAGYASCFSGALNAVAKADGLDVSESTVTAKVSFGKTDSGFGLAVDLVADIPGVEEDVARELVEKAHQMCPYSKATRGNIAVSANPS
ncbi:Ohr subfamily peroxiredoxin [Naumannella cuiyingiana]|uniref:Ohr subfamily peroxiredoxin n=1 Tax=Naumannella cuiyingiana TaxID=1347891 RepID=A0A7Z0IKT6_9ACTN|nr:organic hydroperoxide resistance protein [Naumannella cuiyingiana]NYI70925.1 Ohr subfamily peroxiredoxin [Naumannella cuiyingiana]